MVGVAISDRMSRCCFCIPARCIYNHGLLTGIHAVRRWNLLVYHVVLSDLEILLSTYRSPIPCSALTRYFVCVAEAVRVNPSEDIPVTQQNGHEIAGKNTRSPYAAVGRHHVISSIFTEQPFPQMSTL